MGTKSHTTKEGDSLDIHQLFSTIGYKIVKFLGFNPVLENILILKTAIILVSFSLLISSVTLLILALSHCRSKKYWRRSGNQPK